MTPIVKSQFHDGLSVLPLVTFNILLKISIGFIRPFLLRAYKPNTRSCISICWSVDFSICTKWRALQNIELLYELPCIYQEYFIRYYSRMSLVVQWLRICLPMQETQVQSLVWEDSTCHRATKPIHLNYWTCALESVLHSKRLHHNKKPVKQRVAPACCN